VWSLTVREEYKFSVFENKLLRRIFGIKRMKEAGEDCIMRSFITYMLHHILG
jgi:hypothetical protein